MTGIKLQKESRIILAYLYIHFLSWISKFLKKDSEFRASTYGKLFLAFYPNKQCFIMKTLCEIKIASGFYKSNELFIPP